MGIIISYHAKKGLFQRCNFINERNCQYQLLEAYQKGKIDNAYYAVKVFYKKLKEKGNEEIEYRYYKGHLFVFRNDKGRIILITVYN